MLLRPYNELHFAVRIKSTSPLLIKESRFGEEDRDTVTDKNKKKLMPTAIPITRATKSEITTAGNDTDSLAAVKKLRPFLPATTLRGVC